MRHVETDKHELTEAVIVLAILFCAGCKLISML